MRRRYDFEADGRSTVGLPRDGGTAPYVASRDGAAPCRPRAGRVRGDGPRRPGVVQARRPVRGRPGPDVLRGVSSASPAELFRRLRERNPSPYGFLLNLGEAEYLVGASPEMYVRVDGDRVETCPISGTIARGSDAIGDAAQILALLASSKDESELTMCTDVDRNDKSRICVPGSVRVIGRRQIEMYARLIHTVDHVEGRLRPEMRRARRVPGPRVGGDGDRRAQGVGDAVHRGPRALAARLVRRRRGPARLRRQPQHRPHAADHPRQGRPGLGAGRRHPALRLRPRRRGGGDRAEGVGVPRRHPARPRRRRGAPPAPVPRTGAGRRVLLVDHQDSFVHTLANYLRQTGAEVVTLRSGFPAEAFDDVKPHLAVLSPGPGTPSDFDVAGTHGGAGAARHPGLRRVPRVCRVWSSTSAGRWACSTRPCTARPRASACWAGGSSRGCRPSSPPGAITRCTRIREALPAGAGGDGRERGRRGDGASSTRRCRWRRCSSTRSRS